MITALEKEAADVDAASAANADTSGWTPERRAFRDMYQAADVGKYVVAAAEGREIRDGAEYEYNKHVLQGFTVGDIPLEMFLDRTQQVQLGPEGIAEIRTPVNEMEYRTEVTGPDASHGTPTWMARLFADSEGTYLRASYPAVGPGRHSYPIVTGTGNLGTSYARGGSETAAGGLTITDASPGRIQHSFEYSSVDELAMPGIGAYLASDIRGGLVAGLDNKTVDDLITALTAVDVTSGTTVTAAGLIAAVHQLVDGRGAFYYTDINLLSGNNDATSQTTSHERIGALIAAATFEGVFNWLGRIRASAHMTAASGGEDNIIAVKTRPSPPRLIVPVWRRAQLLRSQAAADQRAGTILLTGVMFADVILVNTDLHTQLRVETQ